MQEAKHVRKLLLNQTVEPQSFNLVSSGRLSHLHIKSTEAKGSYRGTGICPHRPLKTVVTIQLSMGSIVLSDANIS